MSIILNALNVISLTLMFTMNCACSCNAQQSSTTSTTHTLAIGVPAMRTGALSDSDDLLIRALDGGLLESFKLAWGEAPGGHIPLRYFAVISAQNGNSDLLFARELYWSGNPFNQLRAVYWCKNKDINFIEETFWGGLIIKDAHPLQQLKKGKWKDILDPKRQNDLAREAINTIQVSPGEANILQKHAIKALTGSANDAMVLWKFYFNKHHTEPSIVSLVGFDWLALSALELQGFPGSRTMDKYLYWLLIAAENGDPESQWQLAQELNINDADSNARRSFWLKKASVGGYKR